MLSCVYETKMLTDSSVIWEALHLWCQTFGDLFCKGELVNSSISFFWHESMEYPCITLVKTLALDTINEKMLVITKRVQYRNWVEWKIERM